MSSKSDDCFKEIDDDGRKTRRDLVESVSKLSCDYINLTKDDCKATGPTEVFKETDDYMLWAASPLAFLIE